MGAFRALEAHNGPMLEIVLKWIEEERDKRDAENRVVGQENKSSEAYALTMILDAYHRATDARGRL